jgi:putative copper resistance protein D
VVQVIDLYGFIGVVLRGLTLALEATLSGGVIFLCLLEPGGKIEQDTTAAVRRLLRICALSALSAYLLSAAVSAAVLCSTADGLSCVAALDTSFARAQLLAAAGAAAIALGSRSARPVLLLPGVAAVISGAVLTSHAFARLEDRSLLMFAAAAHHLAMDAWIGGLPWLLLTFRRGSREFSRLAARRFSRLATISVPVLVAAGFIMARSYTTGLQDMYGTAYGVMLVAKVILLGVLLALGAMNFRLLRREPIAQPGTIALRRSVELEVALGLIVILVAASMASQPPAVDLPANARVPFPQIAQKFMLHWPHLRMPSAAELSPADPLSLQEAQKFGRAVQYAAGAQVTPETNADIEWSDYMHNWSGVFVLLLGILAWIAQTRFVNWARHWPLVFISLGIFVLVGADPENWPIGPRGFWESFQVPQVMEHRLAALLVCVFAIFEWRVATGRAARTWNALVFPLICMAGGALLLTHSHALGNYKEQLLGEVSHTGIAILAVTAGAARWLQVRLPRSPSMLGFLWATSFVMIGVLLTCYREI